MCFDLFFKPNPQLEESIACFKEKRKKGESPWYEVEELLVMIDYSLDISPDDTDAMEMVDYGLQLHFGDVQLIILKARLYIDRNDMENAHSIALPLGENYSKEVKLLFAEIALHQENNAEADRIICELIHGSFEIDEKDYEEIALLYIYANQDEKAINFLEKGVSYFQESQPLKRLLATYYTAENRTEEAEQLLEKILDESPYSIKDWKNLGFQHYYSGNYEKAVEALEFGLAIDPENRECYFLLGECHTKMKNYEKALEAFIKYAEKATFTSHPYLHIGETYLYLNEIEKAEKSFELVLSDTKYPYPFHWVLYYNLAIGYHNNNKYYKSIGCLNKSIQLSPEKVEPLLFKGRFYYVIGDPDKAYEMFMKVLEMEDFTTESYINIIEIYIELENYEQALNVLHTIREKDPDNPKLIMYSAFCYYKNKEEKNFRIWFRRMIKEHPHTFDDFLNLLPDQDEKEQEKLVSYREIIEKE